MLELARTEEQFAELFSAELIARFVVSSCLAEVRDAAPLYSRSDRPKGDTDQINPKVTATGQRLTQQGAPKGCGNGRVPGRAGTR